MSVSTTQATFLIVVYSLAYVLPLYASPTTRPSPTLTRDAPQVIRARIRVTLVSTSTCSLLTLFLLSNVGQLSLAQSLHAMGYWPPGVIATSESLLVTAALFAGPIYEALIVEGCWVRLEPLKPLTLVWTDITVWRNIVVGPVTEEVLFRAASVPLLMNSGVGFTPIVLFSPLLFGLAHVHHFYEFRITHHHVPLLFALLRSFLQIAYTSLFGAYATFIFLRTRSLLAVVIVHAFCNAIGLPRLQGHVQPHWMNEDGTRPSRKPWLWTLLYYCLLVVGLITWWKFLPALTETD